jgi:peptide/nickel transport system permease protein
MKPIWLFFILLAATGVALALALLPNPNAINLAAVWAAPSLNHPLGTDDLGRDVLARLVAGVGVSLQVGFGVLLLAAILGVPLGFAAGWFGGWVDKLITKLCEVVLSFPGLLLALMLAALLGGSVINVIIALGLLGWVGFCRLTRVQVQLVKGHPYIAAARLGGVGTLRLWVRHVFPNILGPLRVEALLAVAGAMVAEAGLSFLGLGIPAPQPSLGGMLQSGLRDVLAAPLLVVAPSVVLICLTLCVHRLIGSRQAGVILGKHGA